MYRIVKREEYSPVTYMWEIEAPDVANAVQPGHFVIVKHGDPGERIPLTVADFDRERGTVTLVIQAIGKSTRDMCALEEGDTILDVVGPLGKPTHVEKYGHVVCVAGGIGVAPLYPIAHECKRAGNEVTSIVGARSKDLFIMTEKMEAVSDKVIYTTDDGSYGLHGFVTTALGSMLTEDKHLDLVI